MLGLGAGVYYDLGHLEKAAEVLENSRELYDKQYSEESPSYAHPCSYLSVIHHQLGNFTRSKEMADKVYKIFGNIMNVPIGPGICYCYTNSMQLSIVPTAYVHVCGLMLPPEITNGIAQMVLTEQDLLDWSML